MNKKKTKKNKYGSVPATETNINIEKIDIKKFRESIGNICSNIEDE